MDRLQSVVKAVLGPTNTGKTHYAIERMLAHNSGVIGLPLRLLAREVFDRVVALRGPSVVALVTGEERIVPPRTKYWVCTVEAMPAGLGADFVAIDEIQLCADPERGHVFTAGLLSRRGMRETLFLGADTMRRPIATLVPSATFERRERFSDLSYSGVRKISRLPARSAIVGFSVDAVYAIAELVRRQKGGAAVVMGALSPRTRNAQVEMFQNGDVDYLVATDAIGMGLNLDVDHVAFAGLTKFDGRKIRPLAANELAQIAGRAGRYLNNGTFGVTGEAPALEPTIVSAIEGHRFRPIEQLQWRSVDLDCSSTASLIGSLEAASTNTVLVRTREADDLAALKTLGADDAVTAQLSGADDVRLLWDVCKIPDFRNISPDEHAVLLRQLFGFLADAGKIPADWLSAQMERIDRIDGDIDTLSKRLAFVRTWTYVSQRQNWVEDAQDWIAQTRAVEDRLSDALHRQLTLRFVDRRTSVLMRRLKQKESLVAQVDENGEVRVEEQFVGKLDGFRFLPDEKASGTEAKTLRSAAIQALQPEFNLRADRFYNAPDTDLDITEQGGLVWGDAAVGKLVKGGDALSPMVQPFVDDEAGREVSEKVQRRLQHFIDRKIADIFAPLVAMSIDAELTGAAKGIAFRLIEALGVVQRAAVVADVKAMDQDTRALLRKHGVRFGQFTLYLPILLKPAATRLRLVLWSLFDGLENFAEAPPPGLVTVPLVDGATDGYYDRAGYRLAGQRAIRIDMLERLADQLRDQNTREGFEASADMLSITGMTLEQFADLMGGLGYDVARDERAKPAKAKPDGPSDDAKGASDAGVAEAEAEVEVFYTFKWVPRSRNKAEGAAKARPQRPKRQKPKQPQSASAQPPKKEAAVDPDNPFAALLALKNQS